ncbi:MAG: DNA-binding protein [Bacteroidetes bacterium 4484_276]|nr:MAG: DNA-binding protein [Bacteroidetes bacterium 4484_276]
MGRSQESFNKKEVRTRKEKKRKEKEKKRLAAKEGEKKSGLDDMMAYVDEHGMISETAPDPTKKKVVVKLEDIEIGVANRGSAEKIDPIRRGIVSFFNDSKGYGFIRDLETNESVFIHINNVLEDIKEGNMVTFEVEMGPKGLAASQVKISK